MAATRMVARRVSLQMQRLEIHGDGKRFSFDKTQVQGFKAPTSVRSSFLVEDYDFWLRASCQFRLAKFDRDLYLYRWHSNSLTETLFSFNGRITRSTFWIYSFVTGFSFGVLM